jgi:hypothetical protein
MSGSKAIVALLIVKIRCSCKVEKDGRGDNGKLEVQKQQESRSGALLALPSNTQAVQRCSLARGYGNVATLKKVAEHIVLLYHTLSELRL